MLCDKPERTMYVLMASTGAWQQALLPVSHDLLIIVKLAVEELQQVRKI